MRDIDNESFLLDQHKEDSHVAQPNTLPTGEQQTIMVRQSAHFVEQLTLSKKTANRLIQENGDLLKSIFIDQGKVIKEEFSVEDIGIRLEAAEFNLLMALCFLLHDKSENKDTDLERYLMGNHFPEGKIYEMEYGGQLRSAPSLMIEESELIKEYLGRDNYSGKDQKNILSILDKLTEKVFITILEQTVKNKKDTIKLRDYLPLIRKKEITSGSGKKIYIITLNPIIVEQIKTKYVLIPRNLRKRISKEIGHGNSITQATNLLIYYLFHQRTKENYKAATKSYITEINEDNLFGKLGLDKHIKRRQPKRAITSLDEAIRICIGIGLCKKANRVEGKQRQWKWRFELHAVILDPDQ